MPPVYSTSRWKAKFQSLELSNLSPCHWDLVVHIPRPPGWDAAAERRDAQDEFHSVAQARAWADGDFDADHGFAFDGVGRPAH
jgi:hypothetical protein